MAKYRAALIGCGGKGRDHTNTLIKNELVDLVAFCDIREEALQAYQEMYGVSCPIHRLSGDVWAGEPRSRRDFDAGTAAPCDNACCSGARLSCALRKTDGCDA